MYGIDYSGVYSFNKGINKENGTLFLFQFKDDSAFFYLNNFSGAPDFFLTNVKGFLKIDSNSMEFKKGQCIITLNAKSNQIIIKQDSLCKFEHPIDGIYKKFTNNLKKTNTWFTEYTERATKLKRDSIPIFFAPSESAKIIGSLSIDSKIHILDEVANFYLIELNNKKNEFYWIEKKNAIPLK